MISILQISNKAPFPPEDGSSIAIYNMATGFIRNGVHLHLLTINTRKHFKPDDKVPADFRAKSHYRSVYKNTNTSWSGALLNLLFSSKSYFVSRFYFRDFRKALIQTLTENKFDIVQLEGLFMASYISDIRRHSGARIVLRSHNIEHLIWERHITGTKPSMRKWYLTRQNFRLRKFEMDVFSKVDAIVPISSADEKFMATLQLKVPVRTCIAGVDVHAYREVKNKIKPLTLFYFGSMDWLPNQEAARWFLDNCWKNVRQAVPEAKLIIAGKGMPLEFFHIVEDGVSIIETVESSAEFFTSHDLMIVPLLSGSGLRIKIVEGMAYGKAIVSTSIGAEGIGAVHGKEMMLADNATAFTQAVIQLLKDPALRANMGAAAAYFAGRHFDNAAVVSELTHFYNQLTHV